MSYQLLRSFSPSTHTLTLGFAHQKDKRPENVAEGKAPGCLSGAEYAKVCVVLSGGQSPASYRGGQIRPQVSSYDISGGRSVTSIVPFPSPSLSTSFFPCQCHSTNTPYLYLHDQKDERVKTWKIQTVPFRSVTGIVPLPSPHHSVPHFSPVSIIPPILHTYIFTIRRTSGWKLEKFKQWPSGYRGGI